MTQEARLNVKFERELYKQRPAYIKTLYFGLKMNHPRHVAIIHPLCFLGQRVILSIVIVFMAKIPAFGLHLFLTTCLFSFGYGLSEHQWQDSIINSQYLFNEAMIYIISILLVTFGIWVNPQAREYFG